MIDGDADKTISAGARCTIVRDVGGRITGYTHTNNGVAVPSLDQSFGYDNLNRLRNVTLASATTQYTYDATGNRTSKVVGATTYTNTISSTSNRVTQTQDVGGTFSVAYDNAGNITGDGSNTYTYSDRGRMATAVNAGGTVSYQYNALNLRMSKTGPTALVPTGAAYFVYDEQGQLLGEYDANGAPVYETIYLGAMPVGALKRTGTAGASNLAVSVYNVHADHLGAARIITRPSDKAIVWRWDTAESYGGSAANQNPNSLGVFAFNQRFPGQVFDAETGLFQNWNREYNPRIGRYIQSDPIGLAGGINTYSYVEGNPISFVDPSGENIGLAIIGAAALTGWSVYKFIVATQAGIDAGKKYQDMQASMTTWIQGGMKGASPYSQQQLNDAAQACGAEGSKMGEAGIGLIIRPVGSTGSLLRAVGK